MAKLINLNIYEAKNVICVWDERNPERDPECGIALGDALRGFYIPRYVVVGIFDDGNTRAGGIDNCSDLNNCKYHDDIEEFYKDIFVFKNFRYLVNELYATAFVRYTLYAESVNEEEARNEVLKMLQISGVAITDTAMSYLKTGEHSQYYIGD